MRQESLSMPPQRVAGARARIGAGRALAGALALAAALGLILACGGGEPGTYRGQGVVRDVKPEARQVVIEHEDIPGLMRAMTMGFDVEDPALLEGLSPGQAIDFDVVYEDGRYRVTAIVPRE